MGHLLTSQDNIHGITYIIKIMLSGIATIKYWIIIDHINDYYLE